MSCVHSTLHPVGVVRTPVPDHPETLFVTAKMQKLKLLDVEMVLEALSRDTTGYERSDAPRVAREPREPIICYRCGGEGHIARECDDWDSDDWE